MDNHSINTTVPQLRFPDFLNDGEWEMKRLGEIITVNSGRDYKHLQSGDIPVYGTGGYMLSVNDKLSDIDAIGIGRKGTIDKPQYLKAPFWTVDTLFFLTTKEGFDLNFVFFLLQTIEWKKYSEQTGVPSLTRNSIEKIEVKVPPLAEQRRIAACLSALDEMLAATNEKLEQLKAYKKGLMQQLFVDSTGGGKSLKINYLQIPKLRFPEFYEEKEWEEKKLGEIIATIVPKKKLQTSDYKLGGKYPIIDQSQSYICGYSDDEEALINTNSENMVVFGDHTCTLKFIDFPFVQGADGIKVFKSFDSNEIEEYFLYQYLLFSPLVSKEYKRHFSELREKTIRFPTNIEEQRKIASSLSTMDETINAYTEKAGLLGQYKKGLMQRMFPQNQMN